MDNTKRCDQLIPIPKGLSTGNSLGASVFATCSDWCSEQCSSTQDPCSCSAEGCLTAQCGGQSSCYCSNEGGQCTCSNQGGECFCSNQGGQCGNCQSGQNPTSSGSITIVSRSNNSISLRLGSISKATSYVVAYRRSDVSGTAITKTTTSTSVTISGLDPDTEYAFNYLGQNSYGAGPYMPNKVTARTTYTAASFSIADIDTTSITLRVVVGSSTNFIIYCTTPAGREIWNETVTRTSNFNYTISGLIPNTSYKVNVHYDVGNSWCGTREFTTKSARPDNWSWGYKVIPTARLPTAREWDGFCDRVNEFREYKGLSAYSFVRAYPGPTDLTAAMVNQTLTAIRAMSPPTSPPANTTKNVTKLSASLLNGLAESINSIP